VRVMVAGGGTGGHIFPGIAIAEALERHAPEVDVFFMGRRESIEERVVLGVGRRFVPVPSMGLRRGMDVRNLAMPFVVLAGYLRALAVLARRRPDAAVGTGGFISLPPILAARTLGSPVLLQEQNSYPGLATRALSRVAASVHVSFDETTDRLPHAREIVVSGNPVRSGLAAVDRADARSRLGLSPEATVVLFLGGSRGARRINRALSEAMGRLREMGIELVAQTGSEDVQAVRDAAAAENVRAVVEPFFEDVGSAYAASDLVVSRAGATAISEIVFVGLPAILVPYPFATEGHQMKNARAVERAGGAVVIPDAELSGERLGLAVSELLGDAVRLGAMADAARTLARPDAADRVARAVLALARSHKGTAELSGGGARS
jgi:UDP-N-acetylglucosamine--N-acetylmuramyl-(pentapeptide) pyrophosphoryl-undecaprenol N-acetylglucosamine transferase